MLAAEFPDVQWRQGPRRGPRQTGTLALSSPESEWLIFVDDDCIPRPGYLNAYLNAFETADSSGLVPRTYLPSSGKGTLSSMRHHRLRNPRRFFLPVTSPYANSSLKRPAALTNAISPPLRYRILLAFALIGSEGAVRRRCCRRPSDKAHSQFAQTGEPLGNKGDLCYGSGGKPARPCITAH